MSRLVEFLVSTGGFVVAMLVCLALLRGTAHARWARRLLAIVVVAYTLASWWPAPWAASLWLTRGYSPLEQSVVASGKTAVVLLGGGHGWVRDWNGTARSVIDEVEMSRIVEAARVYRMSGDARVISSGGAPPRLLWPNSEVMRDHLVALGVPADRILLESESGTTHDEAVLIARMLPAMQVDRVVLVTSGTHMMRSVATFRAAGITVVPAIARDPLPRRDWRFWLVPEARALKYTAAIIHELLGVPFYAARGWYK